MLHPFISKLAEAQNYVIDMEHMLSIPAFHQANLEVIHLKLQALRQNFYL